MSFFSPKLRLPERLPPGEKILWQGKPQWRGMALRAFHVRQVAIYFALLAAWRIASDISVGTSALTTATVLLWLLLPCAGACGVLAFLAWLSSRTTYYIITGRRVIIQFGVALPITLNIPFSTIGSAALRSYADGSGDIPLTVTGDDRVAYLMLWPHVRPWRVKRTEPMLRSVEDAKSVSEILARAVVAAANTADGLKAVVSDKADAIGAPAPAGSAAAAA